MHTTATTPPMGWNSWDCFGTTVTEAEVLANARFLAAHMAHVGWDTVVVDIQWYEPTARAGGYNDGAPVLIDDDGVQRPAPGRFPSAQDRLGLAPLAAQVHALGLRFGIHLMRGIPRRTVEADLPVRGTPYRTGEIADRTSTCSWNSDNYGLDLEHPGARAWLDTQVDRVVGWGVDLLKVDDMLAPYHADAVEALAGAVARAADRHGRDVVLSLSPGTDLSLARLGHLRRHATMWRVSDDLWDRWEDVEAQLGRLARWAPHQRPGAWADADMLPLGRIGLRAERGGPRDSRLTVDERRTLLSLWCLARSPLFMGGDLPSTDPATIADLVHPGLIDVLHHSTGGAELVREGDLVVWGAEGTGPCAGTRWAGVFSTADAPVQVRVPAAAAGLAPLAPGGAALLDVVDVWTGAGVPVDPAGAVTGGEAVLTLDVPAHGVRLLRLDPPRPPGGAPA
ncbi:glycoside hydrolase family 27 protein [Oerskovia douganii]|nr:glycoside hydrolase family 27 protein [Oerskovia douganii]